MKKTVKRTNTGDGDEPTVPKLQFSVGSSSTKTPAATATPAVDVPTQLKQIVETGKANYINVLAKRKDSLLCLRDYWAGGHVNDAFNLLQSKGDSGLTADFLRNVIVSGKPGGWFDLDNATRIIDLSVDLLSDPSADIVGVALQVLHTTLQMFGERITAMRHVQLSRNTDLAQEHRVRNCQKMHTELQRARSILASGMRCAAGLGRQEEMLKSNLAAKIEGL